jgi:hypothetical protein
MSLFGERLNSMLKYKHDPVISCCCQQSYNAASGIIAAEAGQQTCQRSSFTAYNPNEIILEETPAAATGAYVSRKFY